MATLRCECEAFALSTGFTSKRVCHLCSGEDRLFWRGYVCSFSQEWWRMDSNAPWRHNDSPPPYKEDGNLFNEVPGMGDARRIKPDLVHTFHIGCGADLCSSTLVWLTKLGVFGNARALDERLRNAFSAYRQFCTDTNRYTACDEWSRKKLGLGPTLGHTRRVVCILGSCVFGIRSGDFATSIAGKGHDTASVCRWLEYALGRLDA